MRQIEMVRMRRGMTQGALRRMRQIRQGVIGGARARTTPPSTIAADLAKRLRKATVGSPEEHAILAEALALGVLPEVLDHLRETADTLANETRRLRLRAWRIRVAALATSIAIVLFGRRP